MKTIMHNNRSSTIIVTADETTAGRYTDQMMQLSWGIWQQQLCWGMLWLSHLGRLNIRGLHSLKCIQSKPASNKVIKYSKLHC